MPVMDGVTAPQNSNSVTVFPLYHCCDSQRDAKISNERRRRVCDYLAKPIDMKHLKQTIDRWLPL